MCAPTGGRGGTLARRRDQGKAREVGAGSGGVRASRLPASTGANVAIAEELRVGYTYVLGGCVPNKLLVIGNHFADDFEAACAVL